MRCGVPAVALSRVVESRPGGQDLAARTWQRLETLPDPRSPQGRIYPLACLIATAVCAFAAAGNDWFTAVCLHRRPGADARTCRESLTRCPRCDRVADAALVPDLGRNITADIARAASNCLAMSLHGDRRSHRGSRQREGEILPGVDEKVARVAALLHERNGNRCQHRRSHQASGDGGTSGRVDRLPGLRHRS